MNLHNFFDLFGLVRKRLLHNLGLSASAIVGIVAVLTIAICVPIFANAVSSEVLNQQLQLRKGSSNRQLLNLRFQFSEAGSKSQLDIAKVQTLTRYLQDQISALMGLPVANIVTDIRTGGLLITDLTGRWPDVGNAPLSRWSFLLQENLPQHTQLVEGLWPAPDAQGSGPIQVALPVGMAESMDLQIGDHFLAGNQEIVITAFWKANDLSDPIWFTNPNSEYEGNMWVPEATFVSRVAGVSEQPVGDVSWYVIIRDSDVHFQRASQYLSGLVRLEAELKRTVQGIKISYTPAEALMAYEKRAGELALLFYVVGSPMIVLALIFIGLTARIAIQQYENETATQRARGASRFQVMLLNLVESLLLVVVSIPISLVTGWMAAFLMSQTLSFLQFTDRLAFSFSIDGLNLLVLSLSAAVVILARFAPVISASQITVLKVKMDQSRGGGKPLWERFFLDFLLLIPGLYAYFVLRGWSEPAKFLSQLQLSADQQFKDPLLFIAPALFAMAASMVAVRFIPLIVRLAAALVERLPSSWAYLSLQQIARRSQDHSNALLLIIISLALAIFTVSTAKTLDRWLYDSEYYKVGADLALREYMAAGDSSSGGEGSPGSSASGSRMEAFLTLEEHLKLPGVAAATRVGKYDGKFSFGKGDVSSVFIGIDRVEFPLTAYFRDDFATEALGEIMNALGSDLSGVLFPANQKQKTGVATGDKIAVSISVGTQRFDRELTVVGFYDYFPSVFPKDKPTLVMNLDSIFNYPEDVEGYAMLLRLKPEADIPALVDEISLQIDPKRAQVEIVGNARGAVQTGQDKPERMGLFGILNVGFIATGLMPGIGFLLYSYASLRRRFIQLGILQAIGLSTRQLIASLVLEQSILMGLAILTGAGIGWLTSLMFVPFLQTGATPGAPVPPFQVLIGWAESTWLIAGFGIILLLTMLATILYLARLKVFQAVKLGETL